MKWYFQFIFSNCNQVKICKQSIEKEKNKHTLIIPNLIDLTLVHRIGSVLLNHVNPSLEFPWHHTTATTIAHK